MLVLREEKMKLYACCPICAHKLLKGENGTFVEVLFVLAVPTSFVLR